MCEWEVGGGGGKGWANNSVQLPFCTNTQFERLASKKKLFLSRITDLDLVGSIIVTSVVVSFFPTLDDRYLSPCAIFLTRV